jgi:hypothetical protein
MGSFRYNWLTSASWCSALKATALHQANKHINCRSSSLDFRRALALVCLERPTLVCGGSQTLQVKQRYDAKVQAVSKKDPLGREACIFGALRNIWKPRSRLCHDSGKPNLGRWRLRWHKSWLFGPYRPHTAFLRVSSVWWQSSHEALSPLHCVFSARSSSSHVVSWHLQISSKVPKSIDITAGSSSTALSLHEVLGRGRRYTSMSPQASTAIRAGWPG